MPNARRLVRPLRGGEHLAEFLPSHLLHRPPKNNGTVRITVSCVGCSTQRNFILSGFEVFLSNNIGLTGDMLNNKGIRPRPVLNTGLTDLFK